jgi:chemotaxis protein MotB
MKSRLMIVVLAVAAFLAVTACGVAKDEYAAKVNALKALEEKSAKDSDEAKKKIAELEKTNADLGKEKDTLNGRIGSLENNLTEKQQQLNQCNVAVNDCKTGAAKLAESKKKAEEKVESYESLAKSLQGEIDKGQIELTNLKGKMTVKMKDKVVFASGSIKVAPEGKDALKKIAEAMKSMPNKGIKVTGHTDNVPPGPNAPYADNWELSVKRSLAVVKILNEAGMDFTKMEASGNGQFQPIATNDNEEGRSLNRRIELELIPLDQLTPVPAQPVKAEEKKPEKKEEKKGKK